MYAQVNRSGFGGAGYAGAVGAPLVGESASAEATRKVVLEQCKWIRPESCVFCKVVSACLRCFPNPNGAAAHKVGR